MIYYIKHYLDSNTLLYDVQFDFYLINIYNYSYYIFTRKFKNLYIFKIFISPFSWDLLSLNMSKAFDKVYCVEFK